MASEFIRDLFNRRLPIEVGGNTHGFVELVGGKRVLAQAWEPDALTSREQYYYNTANNNLYKRVEGFKEYRFLYRKIKRKIAFWQRVTEC